MLVFNHRAASGRLISQAKRLNDLLFNMVHLSRYHERVQRRAKINVQQLSTRASLCWCTSCRPRT